MPWTRTVVPGDHHVSVRLTYDGRVTTWNGTVSIAGALKNQLERALHQSEPGAPAPPSKRLRGACSSWPGSRLALAFVAGAVLLRRRRPALAR